MCVCVCVYRDLEAKSLHVAKVAFLNLVVLFLFYNFYVGFNLNYIVVTYRCFGDDYLSGELVVVSEKDIEYVIFFLVGSSIYFCKHCSYTNCSKSFA